MGDSGATTVAARRRGEGSGGEQEERREKEGNRGGTSIGRAVVNRYPWLPHVTTTIVVLEHPPVRPIHRWCGVRTTLLGCGGTSWATRTAVREPRSKRKGVEVVRRKWRRKERRRSRKRA